MLYVRRAAVPPARDGARTATIREDRPVAHADDAPARIFAPDLLAGRCALVTGGGTGFGRAAVSAR